ncbi:MAG: hypothetical protein IJV01_07135 [Bacteroidales bacterium]|nr:hypothetical protein [Bacteroidales bacterium]
MKQFARITVLLALVLAVCGSHSVKAATAAPGAVSLFFRINSPAVDLSFSSNPSFSSAAGNLLGRGISDGGYRVHIRAAASPDGPLSFNRKLAAERAWAAVDLLKHIHPTLPDSLIVVSMVDEDWAGLAAYLRKSDKAWARDALRIVESGKDNREQRLRELYVGEAWDDLAANCFPRLRRAEVSLEPKASASAPVLTLDARLEPETASSWTELACACGDAPVSAMTALPVAAYVSACPEGALHFAQAARNGANAPPGILLGRICGQLSPAPLPGLPSLRAAGPCACRS